MNRAIVWTLAAAGLTGLSGCTIIRTMAVAPVQKAFADQSKQTARAIQQVEGAIKQRSGVLSSLRSSGADLGKAPYPALRKQVSEAQKSVRGMRQAQQRIRRAGTRFRTLSRGRKKLRDDRPGYAKAKQQRDVLPVQHKLVKEHMSKAHSALKSFDQMTQAKRIGKVDVSGLAKDLKAALAKTRKQARSFHDNLGRAKMKLDAVRSKAHPKRWAQLDASYKVMNSELVALMAEVKAIEDLGARFERGRRGRSKMWVGPGVPAASLLADLKAQNNVIKTVGGKLNAAAKAFQRDLKEVGKPIK
jgi:hypothetical protein